MLRTIEINAVADFDPVCRRWHELLADTIDGSFVLSPEWLAAHWKRVGRDRRLRVLVICDDETPVGIVPLNVQTEPTRVGPVRVLTYPLDGWVSFYRPIGNNPSVLLRAALQHVWATRRDWDVFDLRWIPGEGKQEAAARDAAAAVIPAARFLPWERIGLVELAGTWDAYWDDLKRREHNRRRNVLRHERRLAERGEIAYIRYRPRGRANDDADPRWDLYTACEQLAGRSWQSHLTDGNTLSHDSMRDFFREAHEVAVKSGALDLNLLTLDGRPVAFAYGCHHDGYVDVLRIGYDPALAAFGPGNVLWMRLIRDSFERGDRVLDLGPETFHYQTGHDSLSYKRFWCNRIQPTVRCLHYSLSPRAQALRLARWFGRRLQKRRDARTGTLSGDRSSNSASTQAVMEHAEP